MPLPSSPDTLSRHRDPHRILRAATVTAEQFLRTPDWLAVLDPVLATLGEATDVSRIYVFRVHEAQGILLASQFAEWVAEGIAPQIENPDLQNMPFVKAGFERWAQVMRQREVVAGLVEDFPPDEAAFLTAQGILSLAVTPIYANDEWWGFIGYDDCKAARAWPQEEIDALALAANMFGGAIARQRSDLELQRTKTFFQRTLNELPLEIVVLDEQGRYVYISPLAVKDADLRQQLIGKTSVEYAKARGLDPTVFEERRAHIQQVIASKERDTFEEEMETRSGQQRQIRRTIQPILNQEGQVDHVVAYSLDVTEQRRHEQELKRARDEAEALSRTKTTLLANMNHELRTPLTAIMGFSELLKDEVEDPSAIELIRSSGQRLTRTLDTILELAQLESGALTPNLAPVNLTQLVAHALDEVRDVAEHKQLDLRFPDQDRPIGAVTDRLIVGRILHHLLANAVKFTERGSVTVRINVTPSEATLRIIDTGIGLGDNMAQAVEDFWQASTGLTRAHEGNGLGLAITNRLIALLGGTLKASSSLDEGSTFTVTLPRHPYQRLHG